jgi:hypothetical protein
LAIGLLTLVVALGTTLPVYARAVSGPQAHVCHCNAAGPHAHCDCPICFPDREIDLVTIDQMLKGRCGDDEAGWQTISHPAILSAAGVLVKSPSEVVPQDLNPDREVLRGEPPEPRPPRIAS